MKKRIIGILVATIVLAVVAIFYFFFETKTTDLLGKVPKETKSVIVIDLKGLSAKLVLDELSNSEKNADKLVKLVPDTLIDIDWSESGINLLDKAVLFTTENKTNGQMVINALLPLSNAAQLGNFVDSLAGRLQIIREKKAGINLAYIEQYHLLVGWNKNFVIGSYHSDNLDSNKEKIIDILSNEQNESILTDSNFVKNLHADYDLMAYTLPSKGYLKKYQQFIGDNIESASSVIRLNDGKLELEMSIKQKEGSVLNRLFDHSKKQSAEIKSSDSSILVASLALNPMALFNIIEQNSSIKINKEKMPALLAWDGNASIAVNGSKFINNEFISYEYDDEFNKIEIKRTVQEKIYDIQAFLVLNEHVMDSIYKKEKTLISGKDTLFYAGGNYILSHSGSGYICYNKLVERPIITEANEHENISVNIDFQKLIKILNENALVTDSSILTKFPVEKLTFSLMKNNEINMKCKFYFIDKQKNALFSIAEKFE